MLNCVTISYLYFSFDVIFCRGFNDAVNGFNDDGWSLMSCDGAEDVIITVNSTKNLSSTSNPSNSLSFLGGILCAKASMLLQVSLELALWIFFGPQSEILGLLFCLTLTCDDCDLVLAL